MLSFTCRELVPEDEESWEELVRKSPQGNVFLSGAVLRLLAEHEKPRAKVLRVGAFTPEGELCAGWAVLQRRRWIFRYCSSFPLFYAGPLLAAEAPLTAHPSHRTRLLKGLAEALQNHLDILDTEAAPELPEARGLDYAGCLAEQTYTHLWPAGPASEVASHLNRSKRREMKAAAARHTFAWQPATPELLQRFDQLHNRTLEKFRWEAPPHWRQALLDNMRELEKLAICRIFTAKPAVSSDPICAAVSVLLSLPQRRAWLWRVAYETDDPGLIPALYVRAAEQLKEEFGPEITINFGGSPRLSLTLFKDHLGAIPTPHWIISWQRRGWKPLLWNGAAALKEIARRRLHRRRAVLAGSSDFSARKLGKRGGLAEVSLSGGTDSGENLATLGEAFG